VGLDVALEADPGDRFLGTPQWLPAARRRAAPAQGSLRCVGCLLDNVGMRGLGLSCHRRDPTTDMGGTRIRRTEELRPEPIGPDAVDVVVTTAGSPRDHRGA